MQNMLALCRRKGLETVKQYPQTTLQPKNLEHLACSIDWALVCSAGGRPRNSLGSPGNSEDDDSDSEHGNAAHVRFSPASNAQFKIALLQHPVTLPSSAHSPLFSSA